MLNKMILLVLRMLLLFSIYPILSSLFINTEDNKIIVLNRIGEIKEIPYMNKMNSFWSITGVCCDEENNLFVADSGYNKIFKFDNNGKFLTSFGREGQGPGEFLGSARGGSNLRLSYGNNHQIYIMDPANQKLSIFSKEGRYLKQFRIPGFISDSATVDSRGDIYLLSRSGIKLVDCFDKAFKYRTSFIELESHLQFPFGQPPISLLDLRIPNDYEIIKLISKDDNLIIISNYALRVIILDINLKEIANFGIEKMEFRKDFMKRLSEQKKDENRLKMKGKQGSQRGFFASFILPFRAFIDQNNNICLISAVQLEVEQ